MTKYKIFIGSKPIIDNPEYHKCLWRAPYFEFEKIGWVSIDKNMLKGKDDLISGIIEHTLVQNQSDIETIMFWNCNDVVRDYWREIVLKMTDIIRCYYVDDLHQKGEGTRKFRRRIFRKFDLIFSTYAYVFKKFYPESPFSRVRWVPHNVTDTFKVSFNKKPDNVKILVSGALNKEIYPARVKMSEYDKKYGVETLRIQGYKRKIHNIYGHNYIKHLSNYLAVFCCCSIEDTPYIVAKFFEIPASGALLIAYDKYVKNELTHLGFKDGDNYISTTIEGMEDTIKYVLDPKNRAEIDRIRLNGYTFVWTRHTSLDRVVEMDGHVQKRILDK